jgi:hypothetical protein
MVQRCVEQLRDRGAVAWRRRRCRARLGLRLHDQREPIEELAHPGVSAAASLSNALRTSRWNGVAARHSTSVRLK